ncbi:hypothetical protein DWX59_09445 [Enterocloster aldenensis]|nr:hypothetical protein DWX59_09445 [Enterocloster aldenensis]RGC64206.1 hypothetical protein DW690_03155 [Dorea longicatena]
MRIRTGGNGVKIVIFFCHRDLFLSQDENKIMYSLFPDQRTYGIPKINYYFQHGKSIIPNGFSRFRN